MANTRIQIKRSLVTSTPTSLSPGELAYSYASNTLFIGTTGGGPIAIGGTSIADIGTATAANAFNTLVKRDANGAFYGRLYGNWTNNPCLYKKQFYLDIVRPFAGEGIGLEGNISKWWAEQQYKVGHNEGLFRHNDWAKYGR